MKTINLEFIKIPEYIPTEIIQEKLENLNFLLYYFHTKKKTENGQETSETKKKEIQKFLLKEYFNILLIKNDKNHQSLQDYEDKLEAFLKDKIKTTDVEYVLAKEFPQEVLQRKDLLRHVVSKLNVNTNNKNEAIVFQYGEIYINETNLNTLIRGKTSADVLKELMQVWIIFQINRYTGLDNSFLNKHIETTKAKEFFKNALSYEVILKERLLNNTSYEIFWDAFNILNKEIGLTKETQKQLLSIYGNELKGKTDQLFTLRENVFYFNVNNMNWILKESFNKERKKELTKLYIVHKLFEKIKNPDYFSESMFFLKEYAQETQNKLFAQVSKNFINAVFEEVKGYFNKPNLASVYYELGCHAADTMILKDKNTIIFNSEMLSKKIHQEMSSEEEKNQYALLYIFSKLLKNSNLSMRHWNKEEGVYENIEFIKPDITIKEDVLLKSLTGLNSKKLLNTIHNFFKGIELDTHSQSLLHNELILNVLKSNVLQTGKNKEKVLILTNNIALFNQDKIEYNNYDTLLKIYVYEKIFKQQKDLSWLQDESINKIDEVIPEIIEQLKNKISEKDIYLKIKEIEKDLELEPRENYKEFNSLSIELDAKNDLSFMKNDMLLFKHEKKTSLSTAFIRLEVVEKLMQKTIDSYNVKELVKLCLFSKLSQVKEGVLRNKSNHLIVLNENCAELTQMIPAIIKKIDGKVLDQEVNTAITELNEHLPFDANEDYLKRNVINEVKREVGIKVKAPFKHLL